MYANELENGIVCVNVVELLRRQDLIRIAYFFECIVFCYLILKVIIILTTWVPKDSCNFDQYYMLLFISDMLSITLRIYQTCQLHQTDYTTIQYNLNNADYHQLIYSHMDYSSFCQLQFAIQRNNWIKDALLQIYYFAISIYGNILYSQSQQCETKIETLTMIFIIIGYLSTTVQLVILCIYIKLNAQQVFYQEITYSNRVETDQCSICLVDFKKGDRLSQLICNKHHVFHKECIRQWLQINKACPLCKFLLQEQQVNNIIM